MVAADGPMPRAPRSHQMWCGPQKDQTQPQKAALHQIKRDAHAEAFAKRQLPPSNDQRFCVK